MGEHCFNPVVAMLGNHTCNEAYNVGVVISNAICYISHKVLNEILKYIRIHLTKMHQIFWGGGC